jgi:hypothetical protein
MNGDTNMAVVFKADSANPRLIVTERGAGYRLASEIQALF